MGIDTHSLNLLRHATAAHGNLGRTITLGRLAVLLGPHAAMKWAGTKDGAYAESMLISKFGASQVDSVDNSDYEGATIIADMNQPAPVALVEQYDTVLDFGCTEHIFDVAQSMRNVAAMCKPGGMILHAVPANGFCGHGFYQFSPELFFSRYSNANGFTDTEVLLADLCDTRSWYRVTPPEGGQRINVRSPDELYVLVVTRRVARTEERVQQSDYEFIWRRQSGATSSAPPHHQGRFARVREILSATTFTARCASRIDAWLAPRGTKRLNRHPALTRIPLALP